MGSERSPGESTRAVHLPASATKYLGGHSDATGGVVTGRLELVRQGRALAQACWS